MDVSCWMGRGWGVWCCPSDANRNGWTVLIWSLDQGQHVALCLIPPRCFDVPALSTAMGCSLCVCVSTHMRRCVYDHICVVRAHRNQLLLHHQITHNSISWGETDLVFALFSAHLGIPHGCIIPAEVLFFVTWQHNAWHTPAFWNSRCFSCWLCTVSLASLLLFPLKFVVLELWLW